jgi:uncharacterized sporulation protein YeaH/YhbH (DUF444 family)
MSEIIDRRLNGRRKSAANQQRFLRRCREQIREAVARAVTQRSIAETDRGGHVTIPSRDLDEPSFSLGEGGGADGGTGQAASSRSSCRPR